MAGVFQRTYLVHSTYVLFCTRATISVFIVKPTVSILLCVRTEISENEDRRSGHGTAERLRIRDPPEATDLGARVYTRTRLAKFEPIERPPVVGDDGGGTTATATTTTVRLSFLDAETGAVISLPRGPRDPPVELLVLNLPRNRFFEVDGVRESLRRTASDAVECIVFDAPT